MSDYYVDGYYVGSFTRMGKCESTPARDGYCSFWGIPNVIKSITLDLRGNSIDGEFCDYYGYVCVDYAHVWRLS